MIDRVTLTVHEMWMTANAGKARYACAQELNLNPGKGPAQNDAGPQYHIRGCRSEYAGSIILNLFWRPCIGIFDQIDLGDMVEVRSTDYVPEKQLMRVRREPKDVPWMLIDVRAAPTYIAVGWMMGAQVRDNYDLTDGEKRDQVYEVPRRDLLPIDRLRNYIATEHLRRLSQP